MPAEQRGWVRKRKNGWQACWREGGAQRTGPHLFGSKTEARRWLDSNLDRGLFSADHAVLRTPESALPAITLRQHIDTYLLTHGAVVDSATIRTLRERLGARDDGRRGSRTYQTVVDAFGDVPLAELEHMSAAIAAWQVTLPSGYRYAIMRSFRQVLGAAVQWKLIRDNPAIEAGPNWQPAREEASFFESLAEVDRLAVELGPTFGPIVIFGVETGLRPSEWMALERRHVDRRSQVVHVRIRSLIAAEGSTERRRDRAVPLRSSN